jgi:hypothetical protein
MTLVQIEEDNGTIAFAFFITKERQKKTLTLLPSPYLQQKKFFGNVVIFLFSNRKKKMMMAPLSLPFLQQKKDK